MSGPLGISQNTLTFQGTGGTRYARLSTTTANEVNVLGTDDSTRCKLTNIETPTSDYDAATKKYVDDNSGGGGGTFLDLLSASRQAISSGLTLNDTTQSTSVSTGAVIVLGGVGIAKNLHVGGSVNGDIFNTTSDARKKKDIKAVDNSLKIISDINSYSYKLKDDATETKRYGVLAQELLETDLESSVHRREDGSMAVNYTDIVGVLIGAVKELTTRVEELEKISNIKI